MGAWDVGNFSNDDALDFVAEIKSVDDLTAAFRALASAPTPADAHIVCEALAAADLVAAMLGRPASDMPEEASALAKTFGAPSADLLGSASTTASIAQTGNELAELWEEAEDEDWVGVLTDLKRRLDPDSPYEPDRDGSPSPQPGVGGYVCFHCETLIDDAERVDFEFFYEEMPGISMTLYGHRNCLEQNFEGPHFGPDDKPTEALQMQVKRRIGIA